VQFSLGQIPEAERSALDAIHLNPALADADAYLLLARIHERLNDPEAGVADVRSYLKLSRKRSLQAHAQALFERARKSWSLLRGHQLTWRFSVVRREAATYHSANVFVLVA